MTKEEADKFVKLVLQLQSFYTEISTMSKKSSDSPVNKFKLKFINQTLSETNLILGDLKPFNNFDVFVEDEMPTNSDIAMILSQYLRSVAKFYNENTRLAGGGNRYLLDNGRASSIEIERLYILESVYRQ